MKLLTKAFLFCSLWTLLCGCPGNSSVDTDNVMKEFKDNHFDFKDLKRFYFKGIYFDLPDFFTTSYTNFTYKPYSESLCLNSTELGVFFSVEKFSKQDAKEFLFAYDEPVDELIAVHDFYMDQRRNSLVYLESSIKTVLPKGSKLDGCMETVYGRVDEYEDDTQYMIATLEKDNNWYVIQMISSPSLSSYLFDDFKKIIQSVR